MKTVVIVGTMDTKGEQINFVRQEIENSGHRTIIIDTSTRGSSPFEVDVTCDEVANAAGVTMQEIRSMKDRAKIASLMIDGTIKKAKELLSEDKLDGIVSLGGAGAASVGTAVMKALPFGIPKLMVSSAAGMAPYAGGWFGTGDIMMMNTLVDIAGLNGVIKNVLSRAAGSICGMAEKVDVGSLSSLLSGKGKPLVAMTEDGASDNCGAYVRRSLEEKGYEVVVFHANGLGDRAMEDLIEAGFFDGVVDIATVGATDGLIDGNRPGGPKRLEMAGQRGIPLVLAPCSINITGAGPTRKHAEKYSSRPRILKHDELRAGTRLNEEELINAARTVAAKLNKAKGPVRFFIPLKGWSGWDAPGGILHDPEEDMIFVNELKKHIKPEVEISELDFNLDEAPFAQAMVEGFDELMRASGKAPSC